ncbi:MAG TPA: threonine/serine exporter family protein [Myxococcaceae bacterium]|nr:threonine/serine exporter family protein [Myxococcaceae bacterium]
MQASTPVAEDADSALALLLSAARGAQACGYGAEDTERLVSELAAQLGMADAQVSSLPTQLQLAIGIPGQQRLVLLRVAPMPVDLDRIVRLDAVAREVKAGRIGPREASVRIDAIGRSLPPYGGPMILFAYCLAAAGAVLLFGEDAPEAITAAVAGLGVGAIALVRTRIRELDLAAELVSALLAGFVSQAASARIWPLDPRVATLGAVVILLPGFTLTQGVRELQTRNLLSGLAGLGAAAVSFLALVIGAVLGGALGARAFGPARVPPVELPPGLFLLGAAAMGLAAVVVLRAPRREAPTVVGSALLAAAVSHAVSRSVGPALAAFVGAMVIGLVAHLNARLRSRPVWLVTIPGVLVLVPGSIGYRSLLDLVDRDVATSIETGFEMILTAAAIVFGLLMADVLGARSRR